MKNILLALSLLAAPALHASIAYGSLNNFDVVNDTGSKCYGFEIELEDLHSTNITYTYSYNHYGQPRITEDKSDPAHPRVFVRYEAQLNPDGSFKSFTNPQDPLAPLQPTDGHAFTNPNINLGGEHFGVGYTANPTVVNYHWLIEDPAQAGALILGPAVNVSTPKFTYVPPADGVLARADVVIEPVKPEIENSVQCGPAVWVKVFKTVQPSGKHLRLEDLLPDDPKVANDRNWAGDLLPETEIEWQLFQDHPPKVRAKQGGNGGGGGGAANVGPRGELLAADNLPNGDEMVTRRYEFYAYKGGLNPENGEALCSSVTECPDAIGRFIGAQMAGFNVVTPLGLIDHVQSSEAATPYVDRSLVVGGNTPYAVELKSGSLPKGLHLDPVTGVLSGAAAAVGTFAFTVQATDADAVTVASAFELVITPTSQQPKLLAETQPEGVLKLTWDTVIGQNYQLQSISQFPSEGWTNVGEPQTATDITLSTSAAINNDQNRFYRVAILP